MLNKFRETFSVVKNFKIFIIISIIIIIPGLLGLVLLPFGVTLFNFDIEFLGGTVMQYELHTEVTSEVTDNVREIVKDVTGSYPSSLQQAGDDGTQIVIKTLEIDTTMRNEVFDRVAEEYSLEDTDIISSDYVSASVGSDMRHSAIVATLVAVILILLYIGIRFEFKSGLAAIVVLVHDILVMLGVYVIFQIPVNMTFIAAILTILGYSINATIVVFDRIRENSKGSSKRTFSESVDVSVRKTFTRCLNTTITTMFPLLFLIIFGVPSIQYFAIPLLTGVVCGLYSSVCVSGPLWHVFKGDKKRKLKKA